MAASSDASRCASCLFEPKYLQVFIKVASDVGKIKGFVVLGEQTMSRVGDTEETRLHLQKTKGSTGIDGARVIGLLMIAASSLVSLYLISVAADVTALVLRSAY